MVMHVQYYLDLCAASPAHRAHLMKCSTERRFPIINKVINFILQAL